MAKSWFVLLASEVNCFNASSFALVGLERDLEGDKALLTSPSFNMFGLESITTFFSLDFVLDKHDLSSISIRYI